MHKSNSNYHGSHKAHIAVEPDTGIITACTFTPANTSDRSTEVGLLETEPPGPQVLGDPAFGTGQALADHRPRGVPWKPCPTAG